MHLILDYLGGQIIAGIILLIILRLNANITETSSTQISNDLVCANSNVLVQIMDSDLKKAGYGVSDSIKITTASSSRITFKCDYNSDFVEDSISYYLGSSDELTNTPNPNDRLLFRVFNNETPKSTNLGVTAFSVSYYDSLGHTTTYRSKIKSIRIRMIVQATESIPDTLYPTVRIDKIYKPRNL